MRVVKPIVLAVAGVLSLGVATAAAADSHGDLVSALAKGKTLIGEARGDAVSAVAKTNGRSSSVNASSTNGGGVKAKDAHGDAVSTVAKSDATAAHTTGAKATNHGGAVSAAAHKR